MKKIFSIGLVLIFLFSCDLGTVSGNPVEGYHENGNLSYRYHTIDGKRHGVYKEYYPSGKIQIERDYIMDSITAERIWDINDKILVNYVIKEGRYYGLLGSSACMSVFKGGDDSHRN